MHGGVETHPRGVQLFGHGDVQPLLGEQDFYVAAPIGGRDARLENGLPQVTLRKGERLRLVLAGTVSALNSDGRVDGGIRQPRRAQNEPSTTRFFQAELCLLNVRILLERSSERRVERDRL